MTRNTKAKTLVVNLLGGPGCGKSVLAAELFAGLKKSGLNVELVQEYAKGVTWDAVACGGCSEPVYPRKLGNQAYVTVKQFERQCRVDGQVDVIVTDTSLLLGAIYRGRGCGANFDRWLVEDLYSEFWNLNLWLERGPEIPYETAGRKQNEEEAAEKVVQLRKFLADWRIPSVTLQTGGVALCRARAEVEATLAVSDNLRRFSGPPRDGDRPFIYSGDNFPLVFPTPAYTDYELNKG
jgi:predicted ATPase